MYCAGPTYFSTFYQVGAVSYLHIEFLFRVSAERWRDDRPEGSYYSRSGHFERRAMATGVRSLERMGTNIDPRTLT